MRSLAEKGWKEMRVARGGGEACVDVGWRGWRLGEASTESEMSPRKRKMCGEARGLEWETGPPSSETQERGTGKGSLISASRERGGGAGRLRNPGEVWSHPAQQWGWASCPVREEGSSSAPLQDP